MSIVSSDRSTDDVGTSAISDHVPTTLHHDKSGEPSATADGNKSDRGSTAAATTKLLLRGVRYSVDAFGPLKSVAGGLFFILENWEVRSLSCIHHPTLTGAPANESKYTSDRIVGTSSQSAR